MIIFQQSHGARERVQLIRCFFNFCFLLSSTSSSLRISRDFLFQIFNIAVEFLMKIDGK